MATLTTSIDATQRVIEITTPGSAAPGLRFRLDDEALDFAGYYTGPGRVERKKLGTYANHWVVNRGVGGSVAVSHDAGTTLTGAVSAATSSGTLTPPSPFAGTAGGVASFVEPTTATPEEIANALIAAGLMEAS